MLLRNLRHRKFRNLPPITQSKVIELGLGFISSGPSSKIQLPCLLLYFQAASLMYLGVENTV